MVQDNHLKSILGDLEAVGLDIVNVEVEEARLRVGLPDLAFHLGLGLAYHRALLVNPFHVLMVGHD